MAGSMNRVTLIGHLGADPEIRRLPDGNPVANLRIATSDSWRDKDSGEKREHTEWHTVVVFGRGEQGGLAGILEKYAKKGSRILVEGQLRTRKWQDQGGNDRWTTEVHLSGPQSQVLLLDRAERPPAATDTPGRGGGESTRSLTQNERDEMARRRNEEMDDEIPF